MKTDPLELAPAIRDAVNAIIRAEHGPVEVVEVRIVPAPTFFGLSYGTAIRRPDGAIAIRVAVDRPSEAVVDTILHETAHVILGPEHVDNPDHGPGFQKVYAALTSKYGAGVAEAIR